MPAPMGVSLETLAALRRQLKSEIPDRLSDAPSVLEHHSCDEAWHSGAPQLVAFPQGTDEVAAILRACAQHGCPVTAWGAGTSLEGNALAQRGLCLDLSQMDAVLEVKAEDFLATVQAGVRREQLNQVLRGTGLSFPIDPGANATLGGMAATRASGTNAVKYGTMRDNVVACTVVLADGRVIRTANHAPKSAAGYDLTALFVGSEGTLGVITELTVRLHPLPEATATSVCGFDDIGAAVQTVIATMQSGLGVARIELLDGAMMRAINMHQGGDFEERPTLFVEFHGSSGQVAEQSSAFGELVSSFGGRERMIAATQEARSALWKARHNALYATRALAPGARLLITDVCVPVSRLAECIDETRADLDSSGLEATIAGHVGDGNFHAFIVLDPAKTGAAETAEALHIRMARRAIALGGTCTGEHGIGLGKRQLLLEELGPATEVMQAVKLAMDPAGVLNPGKIFA